MDGSRLGVERDQYTLFVEKFKPKKTTDDCYTPEPVYAAIAAWVAREYGRDPATFCRPFYPGGDYEMEDYTGKVVVDNPPFSILSSILVFYVARQVPFFLFAPALTLLSSSAAANCTCLPCGVTITYANGAEVPTSFVTNLDDPAIVVRTVPELYRMVNQANKVNIKAGIRSLPKYEYPDYILTAAMAQRWCKYGVEYTLERSSCARIGALDSQVAAGKSIFGGGLLLSERAAAERAAAERAAAERAAAERAAAERAAAIKWPLSAKEMELIKYLGDREAGADGP